MPELIKGGNVSSIAPPEPEPENTLTVAEALNALNVIMLGYRGFDKMKAILAAAQQVLDEKDLRRAELDELQVQIQTELDTLAAAKKDIAKARADLKKVQGDIQAKQAAAEAAIAQGQADFQAGLEQQREAFGLELKEQARVAQQDLEDRVAGLKRELGGLQKETAASRAEFEAVSTELTSKQVELESTQSRLDTATAALDALKARL